VLQRGAHLGLKTFSWIYAGGNFEDPIDGRKYRKLLPYGRVRTRPNALSPSTLSLERHRALWVYLKECKKKGILNLGVCQSSLGGFTTL